jgi:hypothetical protein
VEVAVVIACENLATVTRASEGKFVVYAIVLEHLAEFLFVVLL